MRMLEDMIEEETSIHLPINLNRYLFLFWALVGYFALRKDFNKYYKTLSSPDYQPPISASIPLLSPIDSNTIHIDKS